MTEFKLTKLQNGSDIRGISLSGEPGQLPNLTDAEAERLSKGYLLWLCRKTGKSPEALTISVGRDPRLSGNHLKNGIFMGMGPYGVTLLDCGLASTPAMFMSTVFPEYNCDGAIMITASHLPYNRNGFKYFDKNGGLNKSDISQIIAFAQSDQELAALGAPAYTHRQIHILGKRSYPAREADLMDTYCAHLRRMIQQGVNHPDSYEKPLTGLKIVVDAGNGSGGFYAKKVLAPLGADISESQYLEPDGMFPNHAPNPEDKAAMESIAMKTLTKEADLGLIFDTDVDRSAAVDHRGREISRNGIVAMAAALVAGQHPGSTVVTDSITSDPLTVFLQEGLKLKHLRFKRGYKNVINKAIELNREGVDCQLAIETSGHAALKENYFLDDGAYLATKIVIKTAQLHREGKTLDSLIADLKQPAEAAEIRIPILASDFSHYGDEILKAMEEFAGQDPVMTVVAPNYEGIRIAFSHGWCLLRKSLHDPILPLNIESEKNGGCREIRDRIKVFLSAYNQLDLSALDRI